MMPYTGSYLWRLRQQIGSELVLMPGAMVVLRDDEDRILLTQRTDTRRWCLPAGAAEVGGSFLQTAIDEVEEEIGISLTASQLRPFGSLSTAEKHTINYPNGDVTHCFAVLFVADSWDGQPRIDNDEVEQLAFHAADDLPRPMHPPAETALSLYRDYLSTGSFQLS